VILAVGAACSSGGPGGGGTISPVSQEPGVFAAGSATSGPFAVSSAGGPLSAIDSQSGPFAPSTVVGASNETPCMQAGPMGLVPPTCKSGSTAQSCTTWCTQVNPSKCAGSAQSGTKPSNAPVDPAVPCAETCAWLGIAGCESQAAAMVNCVANTTTKCWGGALYILGCDTQAAAYDACIKGKTPAADPAAEDIVPTPTPPATTGSGGSRGSGGYYAGAGGIKTGSGASYGTGGY
jgi:hypothetical protein